MCVHAWGNTAVWGNGRGRRETPDAQVSAWIGTVTRESWGGETTHMGDAGAGRTA